jgi:uncharacterized OB-fold protein
MTVTSPDDPGPWIVEQRWNLTYQHTADDVAAKFFRTLRDEGRLLAIRCPQCNRVLFPPRPFCDRDFCDTTEWVEVGTEGEIELFTIVFHKIAGLPEPPYAIAYLRPDGADTAAVNFVKDIDLTNLTHALQRLRIGARARVRMDHNRQGRMTDFWFELVGSD